MSLSGHCDFERLRLHLRPTFAAEHIQMRRRENEIDERRYLNCDIALSPDTIESLFIPEATSERAGELICQGLTRITVHLPRTASLF